MKVEEKKNPVAICYVAMLLLIIHITPENPFTPRQTDGNLQRITHSDVESEGTNGGANDGKVIQINNSYFSQILKSVRVQTYLMWPRRSPEEVRTQPLKIVRKEIAASLTVGLQTFCFVAMAKTQHSFPMLTYAAELKVTFWRLNLVDINSGRKLQKRRFQCPRGLRRGSTHARLLRLWVRIPPGAWMSVCVECCVLSGRGLCDGVITSPEKSYRLWCDVVCDLENSRMRRPWTVLGRRATEKKKETCKTICFLTNQLMLNSDTMAVVATINKGHTNTLCE